MPSRRRSLQAVRFGLMTFPTDFSIAPAELGRAAEDAGFETLLFAEHTHIPVSRDTPNPRGGSLPEKYWHTHDPFVALATVAQATTKLRLGTGICLVVERDPITTAKEVASLDHLSGGRFDFGVGGGWNREEMRNHGTDPRKRFAIMRERILAMKEIWTRDEASFDGDHVRFDSLWSWPKPVQEPHPPVLVGGIGATVLDRVLEYGDEWMPNRAEPEELAPRIAELRERAGRHVPVSYYAAAPEDAFIERLAEAGVDRALLDVPSEGADAVLPLVERYAELAARHR
jgi:probable F420-dependent oxidoreductase